MKIDALANHKDLIPALVQFLHEEWGTLAPWKNVANIHKRLVRSSRGTGLPITFVAIDGDGTLVGSASLKLNELATHPDKQHWLGEVFVHRQLRGRGIGSMLVSICVRHAESLGISDLYLYTPDQVRLYERFGWQAIDRDTVDSEVVHIMRLRLSAGGRATNR